MGIVISKCYTKHCDTPIQPKARIQALEQEISKLNRLRECEARDHEECRRGVGKYRDEVARLKKKAKEDEERIRSLEGEFVVSRDIELLGTEYLVEQMKEEQKQREVAVEKWKQLYLTIKTELDDLILRTKQGGRFGLGVEEGLVDRLQTEVMAKEETIEELQAHISSMEKERVKREREIDILRQSLRILNNNSRKKIGMRRRVPKHWLL